MDWGALLSNPEFWKIIVPTAAGVTGSVLGNRAQGQAINNSQEQIGTARTNASNFLLDALKGAVPYADWGREQAHAGYDQGYGRAAALLDPYVSGGSNAFGRLNSMAAATPRISSYRGQVPGAGGQVPGAGGQVSGTLAPAARTAYPASKPPAFSVPGGGGGSNAVAGLLGKGGPSGFDLSNNAVKPPNFAVRNAPTFGGLAGAGIGSLVGAGAGAAAGTGIGTAIFPGIGTAAGLLVGALVGRLTRAGRERQGATEAVKEYSNWVWNEIMPQARSGKISKAEAQSAIEAGWGQYTNWLDQNIHDSDVNRNSKTSQRAWLDEGLNGPGGWASIPATAVAPATAQGVA